ncbi:MAG: NUMOD4 domain-containing protein, partial [Oscillospiraceae bacterium]
MEEVWKEIAEFQDYKISNLGRVLSTKYSSDKILKIKKQKSGYCAIGLCKGNKRKCFLIHRLVLSTFNTADNMNFLEVNHKDEDKSNNQLDNLEWVTSKDNCNYGMRNRKISNKKNRKVQCVETGVIYDSFHKAAATIGINISSINMCCTGYRNRKTAGGYHWR